MSIMVGVGRGAQAGVLIKNAEALERMEKIDTLVVDKTGTLTEGKPAVTAIVPAQGFDETELLRLAASVERASEHPLAQAIVRAADERRHRHRARGRLRLARRQGRGRQGRRPHRRARQCGASWPRAASTSLRWPRRPTSCGRTARPRSSSAWTASSPARSPSPTR